MQWVLFLICEQPCEKDEKNVIIGQEIHIIQAGKGQLLQVIDKIKEFHMDDK